MLKGFVHNFSIRCFSSLFSLRSLNLKSTTDNPSGINDKLRNELAAVRIVGPFDVPPFEPFRVSPLGIIPKKSPGEFRLILHLSYPHGFSVNDGIPKELASVRYTTIDDAIGLIKSLGQGCFLAKADIKSTFRIIPVTSSDFLLLGMEWQGKFYFHTCLPMESASSCNIFETFSTALEWIAKNKLHFLAVIHILADYLFLGPSEAKCTIDLKNFLNLCHQIGIPIANEKTMGPACGSSS